MKISLMIMMLGLIGTASATPTDTIKKLLKMNAPVQCDLAQDVCTQIAEKSCKGEANYLNVVAESKGISSKVNQIFYANVEFMSGSERNCLARFFNLNCNNVSAKKCKPLIVNELRKYYLDQTMGSTLSVQSGISTEKVNSIFKGCFKGIDSEKKYKNFTTEIASFTPLVFKAVKDDFLKPEFISNAEKIFSEVKSALISRINVNVDDALKTRAMVKQIHKVKLAFKGIDGSNSSFLESMKSMCTHFDLAQNAIEVCMGKMMSNQSDFYLTQLFARELSRLIAPDHASEMGFDDVENYPLSKQMDQCPDLKKSDSKELKNRYDSEKFADHFATDVLFKVINRKNPPLSIEELKDGYSNAVREGCDRGVSGRSLILFNPSIRKDLKCSVLQPASTVYCNFSAND